MKHLFVVAVLMLSSMSSAFGFNQIPLLGIPD